MCLFQHFEHALLIFNTIASHAGVLLCTIDGQIRALSSVPDTRHGSCYLFGVEMHVHTFARNITKLGKQVLTTLETRGTFPVHKINFQDTLGLSWPA
jgi:hypothetical protein